MGSAARTFAEKWLELDRRGRVHAANVSSTVSRLMTLERGARDSVGLLLDFGDAVARLCAKHTRVIEAELARLRTVLLELDALLRIEAGELDRAAAPFVDTLVAACTNDFWSKTRALEHVRYGARDAPASGDDCAALWDSARLSPALIDSLA